MQLQIILPKPVLVLSAQQITGIELALSGIDLSFIRPIFGMLTFNLAYVENTDNDAQIESDMYVTMHEITHVLVFSSALYDYYINAETNVKLTGHVTLEDLFVIFINIFFKDKDSEWRVSNSIECGPFNKSYSRLFRL